MRSILWQRLDAPGVEYFRLRSAGDGWRLRGAVILYLDAAPYFIQYCLATDRDWNACALAVESEMANVSHRLRLARNAEGKWTRGNEPAPDLADCMVPDLMFSPSASLLPVRRLSLKIGESAEMTAAWIGLPDLTVVPIKQKLTRVGEQRYRSVSKASDSSREIEVDDLGLPIRYSAIWRALP